MDDDEEDEDSDLEMQCVVSCLGASIFLTGLLPRTDVVLDLETMLRDAFVILKDVLTSTSQHKIDHLQSIIDDNCSKIRWAESVMKSKIRPVKKKKEK